MSSAVMAIAVGFRRSILGMVDGVDGLSVWLRWIVSDEPVDRLPQCVRQSPGGGQVLVIVMSFGELRYSDSLYRLDRLLSNWTFGEGHSYRIEYIPESVIITGGAS